MEHTARRHLAAQLAAAIPPPPPAGPVVIVRPAWLRRLDAGRRS